MSNMGLVEVSGRIAGVSKKVPNQDVYETELTLPAPSEYEMPGCISVRSPKPLGRKGESVECLCRVSGFPRTFYATDKDTGAREQVRVAQITLTVVD